MTYNQEVYRSVNFKKVYSKANEFLALAPSISEFPFKAKSFIQEQSDIHLFSYRKAREKYDLNLSQFGSESAVILEYNGAVVIFYNQSEPEYRVRFSIMHEFGHYMLGHKMKLSKDDKMYHKQEMEANCFAAQLLMPEQILRECTKRHQSLTLDFIMGAFGVSKEAAQKRKHTLANTTQEWRSREEMEFDDIILMRFNDFLDAIAPKPREFMFVDYEDEYAKQRKRDSWLDPRSKWG